MAFSPLLGHEHVHETESSIRALHGDLNCSRQGRLSLCNLAALRSTQPLPQRMGMHQGAGMGMGMGSGEDVSARKIFIRGLSW